MNEEPKVQKSEGSMEYVPLVHTPIDPNQFSIDMENKLKELNPSFYVSEGMRFVFREFCSTFNSIINRNTNKEEGRVSVIPLATGSAKTTSAKLYLAQAALKGIGGILVVRSAMDAVNAVRDINAWAEEVVSACTYTIDKEKGRPDTSERVEKDELKKHKVIVITHALFKNTYAQDESSIFTQNKEDRTEYLRMMDNGIERKAVIIDERIDMKREESFSNDELDEVIEQLGTNKHNASIIPMLENLKNINEVYFTHKTRDDRSKFTTYTSEFADDMHKYNIINDIKWLRESIKTGSVQLIAPTSKIRGRKSSDSLHSEYRTNVLKLLNRIEFVISKPGTQLAKQGRNTVVSRGEDYSTIFGSAAILDATANVNELYAKRAEMRPDDIEIFYKQEVRNYQNITFHIAESRTWRQSRTSIANSPEKKKVLSAYLEALYSVVNEDDKMLVVTYKELVPLLETRCEMDNITFIHWGIHAGSNQWSHYNKAAAIGWNRLPPFVHSSNLQVVAAQGDYRLIYTESYDKTVASLSDSGIADDLVQFLNRTRSRIAIDEEGNCEPTDFYLFSDGEAPSKSILKLVTDEFDCCSIEVWEPQQPKLSRGKKSRKDNLNATTESIIQFLEIRSSEFIDVTLKTVIQELRISDRTMRRVRATKHYKDRLEQCGIVEEKAKSKGAPIQYNLTGMV